MKNYLVKAGHTTYVSYETIVKKKMQGTLQLMMYGRMSNDTTR
jgi:hypothetical protein